MNIKNDVIEIGGGYGELSYKLLKLGLKVKLFVEPDFKKFKKSSGLLKNVRRLNQDISEIDPLEINSSLRM